MDKKRPGGEFGKRLRDRFIEIGTHPKLGVNMQSFFNFQGTAVKPVCECGAYIHDRPYWDEHRGPLCYRCYLRRGRKCPSVKWIPER